VLDKELLQYNVEKINDNQSRVIANAERNVLKILEGDCDTAVGVYAKITKDIVNIKAELFSVDGKQRFYVDESENEKMINDLSIKIGEKLKLESKGSYKR
jgi:hydroxymethylbilane synthase